MQSRSSITTVVSLLAAAGALALASGAASCAASGAGTNENFTDAAASDATTDTGGGGDSSTTIDSGPACDADTMNSLLNCGSCGHKCGSGQTCSCGMCQDFCKNGMTACCGSCVDMTKDTNNCGQCGNQCLPPSGGSVPGIPHCVASTCTYTCPASGPDGGTILNCGIDAGMPGCFDPTSSAGACGGCGKTCSGSCVESQCCPAGSDTICGSTCVNTQSDPNNCGGCDAGCGGGDAGQCMAGKCTGYGVSNPTAAFIDACSLPGHVTVLQSQFSWSTAPNVAIPFPFSFYGMAQTKVWLQSQGAIGFGPMTGFPPPDSFPDCTVFDPTVGYPAVVVFGDQNLETGPNGVCYGSTSTGDAGATEGGAAEGGSDAGAPNQFVITWSQASDFSDTGSQYTFSIVLTEGTNTLDLQYGSMTSPAADGGLSPTAAGGSATVGMQQGAGSMVTTPYSCHSPFITSTPFDVRFTPH